MQITYQKQNGCIIYRLRSTILPYKIGEITSMGWKVLNIEYQYKDKFYSLYEYNKLLHKENQNYIKKKKTKEFCMNEFKTFVYYFIVVLLINFLKLMLGF